MSGDRDGAETVHNSASHSPGWSESVAMFRGEGYDGRPMADQPKRRARRPSTSELRGSAVRLLIDTRETVRVAYRDLDLTETGLRD